MREFKKIYDFHNHIVNGVDDGSDSLGNSIKMLRQAVEQGITHVVCTPHQFETDAPLNLPKRQKTVLQRFNIIKKVVKNLEIPIELSLGSEIMFFADIKRYLDVPYMSINDNKKYVMIEFRLIGPPVDYIDVFYKLILCGYKPILAHPERINGLYREKGNLIRLLKMGVLFQINTGSLLGYFGGQVQAIANKYLRNNWIHLLGSDAHTLNIKRGFSMQKGIEYITNHHPQVNLKKVLEVNPKAVIAGKYVEVDIEYHEHHRSKKGFFSKNPDIILLNEYEIPYYNPQIENRRIQKIEMIKLLNSLKLYVKDYLEYE